jgi:transposase
MIQLTPQMRILLAVDAADFRKGIDGLCGICRQKMQEDPFTGTVFVFRNRRGTAIKILAYDGQGYWLCQKRLSAGKFRWWPREGEQGIRSMAVHELQVLLWNGDAGQARIGPMWREVPPNALLSDRAHAV